MRARARPRVAMMSLTTPTPRAASHTTASQPLTSTATRTLRPIAAAVSSTDARKGRPTSGSNNAESR